MRVESAVRPPLRRGLAPCALRFAPCAKGRGGVQTGDREIVEDTLEMPAEVVAELVDRIMAARLGGIEPPVAPAWKAETDRRIAEIEAGTVKWLATPRL